MLLRVKFAKPIVKVKLSGLKSFMVESRPSFLSYSCDVIVADIFCRADEDEISAGKCGMTSFEVFRTKANGARRID